MELQPIQNKIFEICGQRVMLDFDLAALYQVEIRRRLMLVKRYVRDNLEAIKDLSVDV